MMSRIWERTRAKLLIALGVGILAAPVWGADAGRPGTVNYVEGEVTLNGAPLNGTSVGTAELQSGQMLETEQGKAEVLLTPGVFIRLDDNSQLRMIAAGLTDTRVELMHGKAMLEATGLPEGTHLSVLVAGSTTDVAKEGLYEFDANQPDLRVYDGQAWVTANDKRIKVKKGRETALAGIPHARKFDRDYHDALYAWSNVRSQTLAEASAQYARTYVDGGGYGYSGWYGSGWYWNPYFSMYSYLPGSGVFYSPFGWPFYSPGYIWYAPRYYGNIGRWHGNNGRWHGGQWAHRPTPGAHSSRGGHNSNLRGRGGMPSQGARGVAPQSSPRGGFHPGGSQGRSGGSHRGGGAGGRGR